jgi:L-ascorbate metabolism protein UlaG (beta-lactamase superfamily)
MAVSGRRWRRLLLLALALTAVLVVVARLVLSQPQFGAPLSSEQRQRAHANPHYHEPGFVNDVPPAAYRFADIWIMLREQFFGTQTRVPPAPLPVLAVDRQALAAPPASGSLRALWIGHASVYIEIDGLRMLVDPIFSDYASPFAIGPRRFQAPAVSIADLPAIDAVLITHDHYDHLDMRSVQQLASRGTTFVVPLGIGAHLAAWGVSAAQIHELEWWQEHGIGGVRVISTPARHYSGRSLSDARGTLWTSWAVIGPRHRFYVSGDTGYSEHFRAIGARFGPFDMSFMKIGAYGPGAPWLDIHMSVDDAVRANVDVGARRMFPVHWGTFNLAFHDWDEPIKRAVIAAQAADVELLTPRLGEFVDADQAFPFNPWWETVR